MSVTPSRQAPGGIRGGRVAAAGDATGRARHGLRLDPVTAVILAATLLALALRVYQAALPGHLFGVGDYDDGADFGGAIMLVHGVLPYRDFVLVQPPGALLVMAPAALLSLVAGSAWAIAVGKILTILASTACVALGGLLVRHRGLLATVITCGIIAVYPGSVQAAHTTLLEPWLVLFCLVGACAVFDGDQPARGSRLVWGGVALGFAGAVKVWAIIPVAVISVLCLPQPRKAVRFLAGVAAGFLVPALPFIALAPGGVYRGVVVAQLVRTGARTPLNFRLQQLTGLVAWQLSTGALVLIATGVLLVVAALTAACAVTGRRLAALDWFAVATAALVTAAFLLPTDFYYHYPAFLAPFLGLAIALPAGRLLDDPGSRRVPEPSGRRARLLRPAVIATAALAVVVLPLAVPTAESSPTPTFYQAVTALKKVLPPGACVLTDQASLLIAADRFPSTAPGCPPIVDGTGTALALGGGRTAATAGSVPAVARVWMRAFRAADWVVLTRYNGHRIAWTPALRAYFRASFAPLRGPWQPLQVYVRRAVQP